jgi:RNA polymerase sigma-70 factor (ECF subfamily)
VVPPLAALALEMWPASADRAPVDGRDPGPSVADLVVAARRGRRASFDELYRRFHRAVHAVALGRVLASDAADVVQEVFAEAWSKLGALREPAAFPGWILTLARSRALDQARRNARPASDVAVGPALQPSPEARRALAALRELPDTYRETMIMRLVEGMTGPEIALRTGMTPDSVRVHLHRGMQLLRERLGTIGGSTP